VRAENGRANHGGAPRREHNKSGKLFLPGVTIQGGGDSPGLGGVARVLLLEVLHKIRKHGIDLLEGKLLQLGVGRLQGQAASRGEGVSEADDSF